MDVLGGRSAVESIPLTPIPHPDPASNSVAFRAAGRLGHATSTAAASSQGQVLASSRSSRPSDYLGSAPSLSEGPFPGTPLEEGNGAQASSGNQEEAAASHADGQQEPALALARGGTWQAAPGGSTSRGPLGSTPVGSPGMQNPASLRVDSQARFDEGSTAVLGIDVVQPVPGASTLGGPPANAPAYTRRPASLHGDSVVRFDEVSAARGALGRFPGCEVMGLVKAFISAGPRTGM